MSDNKLLEWLLREDMFKLREGLEKAAATLSATQPKDPEPHVYPDETEPAQPDPTPQPTIAAAGMQYKKRPSSLGPILAILLILAAVGGLLFMPPQALGPLSGVAATIQATIFSTPERPELDAAGQAPVTTTAAAPLTSAASEMTQTARAATASASAATAPSAATSGIIAPEISTIYLKTEAFAADTTEEILGTLGYPAQVTTRRVESTLREVWNRQPATTQDAAFAAEQLRNRNIQFEQEETPAGVTIRIAPLPPAQADKAAAILVNAGIPPQASDSVVVREQLIVRIGPFENEYDAESARADLTKRLDLKTTLEPLTP